MTEKRTILEGIVCNGDSIVEACENANLELLRNEGDGELADLIEKMLDAMDRFADMTGLNDEELVEKIIAEDIFEETPQ